MINSCLYFATIPTQMLPSRQSFRKRFMQQRTSLFRITRIQTSPHSDHMRLLCTHGDHGDRDGGSKCVPKNIMILKSLKVQEKSFQAFLCLLECSRVGKRTKVCKLEPPGTLIKSAYLSPMVPRGCSPLDRYSCSSGKLGNASSSFSCPSILIPPSD